jgi:opacity protein-like surface antigen
MRLSAPVRHYRAVEGGGLVRADASRIRPARPSARRPARPDRRSAGIFVNNANLSGWTVGAGLDYAFTNNVFGRIEYRYTDLGTTNFLSVPTNSGESGNKVTISDLRVGIAHKFNPDSFLGRF